MWYGRSWSKLLAWIGDERALARTMVRRRAARGRVCALLTPQRLPVLGWRDLTETLCRFGTISRRGGGPLTEEDLAALSPEELGERIASGAIVLSGNQTMDAGSSAHNAALPGMDDRELERIRHTLGALLHGSEDPVEMVDELAERGGPLSAACASLALCLMYPDRFGVWQETRVRGARKLRSPRTCSRIPRSRREWQATERPKGGSTTRRPTPCGSSRSSSRAMRATMRCWSRTTMPSRR